MGKVDKDGNTVARYINIFGLERTNETELKAFHPRYGHSQISQNHTTLLKTPKVSPSVECILCVVVHTSKPKDDSRQ